LQTFIGSKFAFKTSTASDIAAPLPEIIARDRYPFTGLSVKIC
jgi:hypothetical protein